MHPAVVLLHAAGLPDGVGEGAQASPVMVLGHYIMTSIRLVLCLLCRITDSVAVCLIFCFGHIH